MRKRFQAVDLLQYCEVRVDWSIAHRLRSEDVPRVHELIESRDPAVKKVIILI